jgi:hypothetical protein
VHASLNSITPDIRYFPSMPPDVPDFRGAHLKAYIATLDHPQPLPKWLSYFRLTNLNDMRETCPTTRGSFGIAQGRDAVGHVLSDRRSVDDLLTPIDDGIALPTGAVLLEGPIYCRRRRRCNRSSTEFVCPASHH